MTFNANFVTLTGPAWPDGLILPDGVLWLVLSLETRGFTLTHAEGRLLVTPPHDAAGQPQALSSEDRSLITRYKAHLIVLTDACKVPFPPPPWFETDADSVRRQV